MGYFENEPIMVMLTKIRWLKQQFCLNRQVSVCKHTETKSRMQPFIFVASSFPDLYERLTWSQYHRRWKNWIGRTEVVLKTAPIKFHRIKYLYWCTSDRMYVILFRLLKKSWSSSIVDNPNSQWRCNCLIFSMISTVQCLSLNFTHPS